MKKQLATWTKMASEYQISETGVNSRTGRFSTIGHVLIVGISGTIGKVGDISENDDWISSYTGLIGVVRAYSIMSNNISVGLIG